MTEQFLASSRKHRPRRFAEVRGQPVAVRILQQAIAHTRIADAYLFSGPRGTGKTSLARLLAATLNCMDRARQQTAQEPAEPCGRCESCQWVLAGRDGDVLELDAASHGGVDDARALEAISAQEPPPGKWRIVILDEAQQLTTAAQNALLKLIESPPKRFLFILCTTEPQKILPTIRSRCSQMPIRPLPPADVRSALERIFLEAGQPIEPSVLDMLALQADGSLRDVQQVADQLVVQAAGEKIDDDFLEYAAGIPSVTTYKRLAGALTTAWVEGPHVWFDFIEQMWSSGFDISLLFYQVLLNFLRDANVALHSKNASVEPVPYFSGIPHRAFVENLAFTQRDLDILDDAWTTQESLMRVSTGHRATVEFWFLKAWNVKKFDQAGQRV